MTEPEVIVSARAFLEELDAARERGMPAREALQWATASDHTHALLKAVNEARETALEDAAKACEAQKEEWGRVSDVGICAEIYAEAVRALKAKP